MPELPQMQALAERLDAALAHAAIERVEILGVSGLKTVLGPDDGLVGARVDSVARRAKYLVVRLAGGSSVLVHLAQAGRVDLESPPKSTRPRGAVVRLVFDNGVAVLVREHGHERRAGWWVVASGEEGPLAGLGPEPSEEAFAQLLLESDAPRRLHALLRDQRFVAGVGRGYADDALNRAGLSPFALLRALPRDRRQLLVDAVRAVLDEGLERERERTGGLSEPKLGTVFTVHNRAGQPCPRCGERLLKVSFESHEVVYCKHCQTNGRALADRRMSRLLR